MDLQIRDRILAKEKSPELTQLLKEKSAVFPLDRDFQGRKLAVPERANSIL
ncbi:hypothetical protein AB1L30_01000 [Bremerella sp. JC817]|uniref:hypothetical protein n=1 Tax=Bremerella sp. JC817 TaxID=3231756 RepID=UPI003459FD0D